MDGVAPYAPAIGAFLIGGATFIWTRYMLHQRAKHRD